MSKGSQVVPVRLPPDMKARVKDAIARINRKTQEEPHNVSSFVRKCIEDKLAHMERGRKKATKEGAGDGSQSEIQIDGRTEATSEAAAQVQAG